MFMTPCATMGVTFTTGIISVLYEKKVIKKILQTADLYPKIIKNRLQKSIIKILYSDRSKPLAAFKKRKQI